MSKLIEIDCESDAFAREVAELEKRSRYYAALTGEDGQLVPGSRLSKDFTGPAQVRDLLPSLRLQYPRIAIFHHLVDGMAGGTV